GHAPARRRRHDLEVRRVHSATGADRRTGSTAAFGMTAPFDDVSLERLRRRRTVKWTLYGPDVLAAWVAEMDFDVAPEVRAAVVESPMIREADRDTLDLDAIDATLAAGARAVLLCSPHNPTGRVFTTEELRALAAIVDRHGARVVADEVHAPLVYAGHDHVPYATVSDAAGA